MTRIIGIVSKIDFHLENSKQLLLLTFSDTLFSKDGLDEKILKLKFVISSYPIAWTKQSIKQFAKKLSSTDPTRDYSKLYTFSIDFIGLTKQADVSTTLWMFWRWLLIANLSKWEHGAIGTVCKFLHKLQNPHLQPIHLGTISNYTFFSNA